MAGTLAAIFSLDGSKKWIARLGRAGISRSGSGAPTARGRKKSLAERMRGRYRRRRRTGMTHSTRGGRPVGRPVRHGPPPEGVLLGVVVVGMDGTTAAGT